MQLKQQSIIIKKKINSKKFVIKAMQILNVTDKAKNKVIELLNQKDKKPLGIRLSLITKGCSGLSWRLEFIEEAIKGDEIVKINENTNLYIDKKAMLFILGSNMDYQENELESGFIFFNPNENGKCGCGKSFYV
jgi:iron-sulfur cluster assembly protein